MQDFDEMDEQDLANPADDEDSVRELHRDDEPTTPIGDF